RYIGPYSRPASGFALLTGLHAAAHGDPLGPLHVEQLGNAPDQVILDLMALAVGIDHLPENADELDARLHVEMALEHAGKGVEVNRLAVSRLAGAQQPLQLGFVDAEMAAQRLLEQPALLLAADAVRIHEVEHERRGGDLRIIFRTRI